MSTPSPEDYHFYEVQKMRYPSKDQKYTIIYNPRITLDNIPPQAFDYIVNGKSAIDWLIERYQQTTHTDSGITNNPNDWAKEHQNPRYIIDLLHSVINLSTKSVDIINSLPTLNFN
ncbi:MAG: hypothetical protein FWH36_07180 [Lentimicrobiaceae bacterium]|nr:hypothetical protein [Lentimicrobiaceae bacterium]